MKQSLLILTLLIGGLFTVNAETPPLQLAVRLDDGSLLGTSQRVGLDYVLRINPDRLLAPCWEAVGRGNEAKAERYGGWEARQIAGHSLGHYLSALAGFWADTGDQRVKAKLDYTIGELKRLQQPNGYLGGVEETPFLQAFTGDFQVDGFSLAGYWVPWYSVHKIFAGLIDAYRIGGNRDALTIATKFADWAAEGSASMTPAQFQKMLTCEHGGMCEAMADLYAITGDERYLALSKRFIHSGIAFSLFDRIDALQGMHANTQIPKVIGLARLHELTGEKKYRRGAEFFFDTVTKHRSFVIGGNSVGEHFGEPDREILSQESCETCNSYNMLKLAEHLFAWSGDATYADYIERTLYNHILASQDPTTGAKEYFVSTYPGHFKVYGTEDNSFWCCTGTGMENPERYNRFIWARRDDGLYLNLFASSRATLADLGLELKLDTRFPYSQEATLTVVKGEGKPLTLKIRKPTWMSGKLAVTSGDRSWSTDANGYLAIDGNWKAGDTLKIALPMELHQYTAADDKNKIALLYGPIVLAASLGTKHFPESDVVGDHLSLMGWEGISVPTLVTDADTIADWVHPVDASKLLFETTAIGEPGKVSLKLRPFFDLHHERYTIYLCKVNAKTWAAGSSQFESRDQRYQGITIDTVKPGAQQSEIEHHLQSAGSQSGYISSIDLRWRDARGQSSFISYEMQFEAGKKNDLMVTYYGRDGIGGPSRRFTILVNDVAISTVDLHGNGKDEPMDVRYPVDPSILKGLKADKDGHVKAEVRFETVGDSFAGGILEVRTLRQ